MGNGAVIDLLVRAFRRPLVRWLTATILIAAAAALVWTSYNANSAWRSSALLLADRRADAGVNLLVTALTRDMRGVQTLVLPPGVGHSDSEIGDRVASAFARYPYPETFFSWHRSSSATDMTFFSRADRLPAWVGPPGGQRHLPVLTHAAPALATALLERISGDAMRSRSVALFDLTYAGSRYQVAAQLAYDDRQQDDLSAAFGFMVDLAWTRSHYFPELVQQVQGMEGLQGGLTFLLHDEQQRVVVGPGTAVGVNRQRAFPLLFFDPVFIVPDPPADLAQTTWTAEAVVTTDPVLSAANRGARQTLLVTLLAIAALVAGVLMIAKAAQANAALAQMRAEFMLAITHELKTPIASVRVLTETLASGRASTPEMTREYGRMAAHEAKRLGRLIDNLLAHARITDVTEAYTFETVGADVLLDDTLYDFRPQLESLGFDVDLQIDGDSLRVRADRVAIRLALGNVIDNAIRYSSDTRSIGIDVHKEGPAVVIAITDKGTGIPADEVDHVQQKFFRGRGAPTGGSGLGLAITKRIVADHGGSLLIESLEGVGTTVRLTLPHATNG